MLTASLFLLVFCSGCLLAIFRHPIFGFITYVSLTYIHPPSAWWGDALPSVRWSLLAAGITVIGVFVHKPNSDASPIFKTGVMLGMLVFIFWLVLQSFWTINPIEHRELTILMIKYTLLMWLVSRCLDSLTHVKYFFWAHAAGCFYLGTVVLTKYMGGRFEGFRGPGLDEANAAGLQIVSGIVITFVIFLQSKKFEKAVAVGMMPIILNGLVATISRSGFLALTVTGILFNYFCPKKFRRLVVVLSLMGLGLFVTLTNPVYWERIETILMAGEEVEGRETGIGRITLMKAQLEMFEEHPLGCGHRCTATLSPYYLDRRYLTVSADGAIARSSHNTFLTLLVEQGVLGVLLYVLLLLWLFRTAMRIRGRLSSLSDPLALAYTATISILGAITVADLFVDYLKFEVRFLFIALLLVIDQLVDHESQEPGDAEINAESGP